MFDGNLTICFKCIYLDDPFFKYEYSELYSTNIAPTSKVRAPNLLLLLFIENYGVGVDFGFSLRQL